MQKSVLIEIIRSLHRKEMRDIQKWLQSPVHNQRQDVVRLFDYLGKNMASGNGALEKEAAWEAIFPKQPFDDAYMRQVMYFLLKAIEEYLVYVYYTSDKVRYQLVLARVYKRRKLEKSYKQAHRLGMENLENQPLRNGYFLLNKYFLEKEEYEHRLAITQNASVHLQEMADALETWFVLEKFQISNAMLAHHNVYRKANYDHGLLQEILNYSNERQLLNEPSIAAYYYAYMAITHPAEEQYFEKFEQVLHSKTEGLLTLPEMRNLYLTALNYCTAKVNQGMLDYCRRALTFYRLGVEKGLLLENNIITRYTFGNAVAFALKIREFDWAEQFIERFQHHLDEKERNSIVNFNLARLYFETEEYGKAQQLLTKFEYDDMVLNLVAKTMLLKIYYEESEYDAFESLLEAMRTYLHRKDAISPSHRVVYKNLLSVMRKLGHLNPYSAVQKENFRKLVMETNPLSEREWILKQLDGK